MFLTVDVCNSSAGAAFLFVLPLLVWQLADDNRWWALLNYWLHLSVKWIHIRPLHEAFSLWGETGTTVRRRRRKKTGRHSTKCFSTGLQAELLSALSISLTHTQSSAQTHTQTHKHRAQELCCVSLLWVRKLECWFSHYLWLDTVFLRLGRKQKRGT